MKSDELKKIFSIIGYRNLFKQLNIIFKKSDKISTKRTVEHLHKVRVASRRARTILGIFKTAIKKNKFKVLHSRISNITETLGEARDIDVQIEFLKTRLKSLKDTKSNAGIKYIIKQRKVLRKEIQSELEQNLARLKKISFSENLHEYFKVDSRKNRLTNKKTKEIINYPPVKSYLQKLHSQITVLLPKTVDADNKTELHLLRKKIKKLRYAFEILMPYLPKGFDIKLKSIKNLQESLGIIHDMDVWDDYLSRLIQNQNFSNEKNKLISSNISDGIQYLITYCKDKRDTNFNIYLSEHHLLNKQNFWEEILSFYS